MSNTTNNALAKLASAIRTNPETFRAFCATVHDGEHEHFASIASKNGFHTLWCKVSPGLTYKELLDSIDEGEGRLSKSDKSFLSAVFGAFDASRKALADGGFAAGSFRVSYGKRGVSVSPPTGREVPTDEEEPAE